MKENLIISKEYQQNLVTHPNFKNYVIGWINDGYPLYPEIQKQLPDVLPERDVAEIILLLAKTPQWIDIELLIWWIWHNASLEALKQYYEKHKLIAYSRKLCLGLAEHPQFVELYGILNLDEYSFSTEAQFLLIRRPDFCSIAESCYFSFHQNVQMELAEDHNKLLAYSKNSEGLCSQVLNKVLDSLNNEQVAEVLSSALSNEIRCLNSEVIERLLNRNSYDVTIQLVKGLPLCDKYFTKISSMARSNDLIKEWIKNQNCEQANLKAKIFELLNPEDEEYHTQVSRLLFGDVDKNFVFCLTSLSAKIFESLSWNFVAYNSKLWDMLFKSSKSNQAIEIYFKLVKESYYDFDQILPFIIQYPFAIDKIDWVIRSDAVLLSLKNSPYYAQIEDFFK